MSAQHAQGPSRDICAHKDLQICRVQMLTNSRLETRRLLLSAQSVKLQCTSEAVNMSDISLQVTVDDMTILKFQVYRIADLQLSGSIPR